MTAADFVGWVAGLLTGKRVDRLEEAGRKAAAEAVRLWELDIFDPPKGDQRKRTAECLKVINEIIHRAGWTWVDYKGDGPPQWCGLTAAACWRTAGIDPKYLATFWASTLRLNHWALGLNWGANKAGGPRPFIALHRYSKPAECVFPDGSLPRAGDVLVVGDGHPAEGDHICIVLSYDATTGTVSTISGNGGGMGPNGDRRQGISKADYRVGTAGYCALRVYRPLITDLL